MRRKPTNRKSPTKKCRSKFRSHFEEVLALQLEGQGIQYGYETIKVDFVVPEKRRYYLIDFQLPNGIIVEAKGIFDSDDRLKHLLIKKQRPDLDIRFVFQNVNLRLYKGSNTRIKDWCEKNGFKYAVGRIPQEWIDE